MEPLVAHLESINKLPDSHGKYYATIDDQDKKP